VFDRLMADHSLAALGGVRRHMTVLFSDVRGFTAMSEKGTPEDVVRQLNEYFTRMVEVLFERRGTLDKFVGDMVMALFGAPLDDPDHADHAVETALAMSRALDDLNRLAARRRDVYRIPPMNVLDAGAPGAHHVCPRGSTALTLPLSRDTSERTHARRLHPGPRWLAGRSTTKRSGLLPADRG
jgi:hypothetical protein